MVTFQSVSTFQSLLGYFEGTLYLLQGTLV